MKKICIILAMGLCCSFAHGQNAPAKSTKSPFSHTVFQKGDNVASLGIGFGGTLHRGRGYSSKMPFFSLSYERCLFDNLFDAKSSIGVGGIVGYTSAKWKYGGYGWKYTSVVIGLSGAMHYQFVDKLDTYTGLMFGYEISSAKTIGVHVPGLDYSASSGGFAWSWHVGARYYFTNSLAAFAELGYGVSIFNMGLAFKF